MRKYIGGIIQGIAGFGTMIMLWCVGAICQQYSFEDFEAYISSVFYYIPNIVLFSMIVLLFAFAYIGKRNDFKVLYFSSLLGVWLPILAFICSCIFSDDGNILCWIYAFSLGLLLSPFHRLAWSTFDGVWIGDFGMNPHFCAGLLVVSIVLSYIIFKFVKTKKIA